MTRTGGLPSSTRERNALVGALAGLASLALLLPALARAGEGSKRAPSTATAPAARADKHSHAHKPAPHRAASMNKKAKDYYRGAWGVDGLKVSRVASGSLIRFTYRVTEPAQAAPLVDRNAKPILYAPRTRAVLSVPAMENVGPLRQTGALKAGQEYWLTFSNRGNLVKAGDRVNVVIGSFHADGLTVE